MYGWLVTEVTYRASYVPHELPTGQLHSVTGEQGSHAQGAADLEPGPRDKVTNWDACKQSSGSNSIKCSTDEG